MTPRRLAVLAHRYVGLGLAAFLAIAGTTGAAVAWNDRLERVFAPALFVLPPSAALLPPLDPFVLREAAARAVPGFAVNGIDFTRAPDTPARFFVEAVAGGPPPVDDEIALDPSSGRVIGRRHYADLSQGIVNVMPFIYSLHTSLALGSVGTWMLGVAALLWTIDCFVGLYLTFPVRARRRRAAADWTRSWVGAWRLRWPSTRFKLTFDLHNAAGLWLWFMLLMLAWSGVAFNLPGVYQPVTRLLLGSEPSLTVSASKNAGTSAPGLDWRAAHEIARTRMAAEAQRLGFAIRSERLMFYDAAERSYAYRVRSSLDPGKLGNTQLTIDADDGHTIAFRRPTGAVAGETFTTWLLELHTAGVFGIALQMVLTVTGLAVALLSVTGVMIWLRKLYARRAGATARRRKLPGASGTCPTAGFG